MDIPQSTVEHIERAIRQLATPGSEDLRVPEQTVHFVSLFAEAGLLQFVISWARRHGNNANATFDDLIIDSETFDHSLERLLGKPYALAMWVLAKTLYDASGARIGRKHGHVFSRYLDAMDAFDFGRTHESSESRVNLLCIQGSVREFIRPLYLQGDGAPTVRPFGEIRVVVQDALAQLNPEWSAKKLLDISEPLTQLTRELVENSDWWARADERGVAYDKGIRAITFRVLDIDDTSIERFAGTNTHVRSYLHSSLAEGKVRKPAADSDRATETRVLSFVEMSIVDSGPGLARRWLSSDAVAQRLVSDLSEISLEDEEAAVVACFRKWATSSGNLNRGIGLFSVARLLRRRKGFMRLRTGRLAYLFGTQSAISDIERRVQLDGKATAESYVRLDDGTHVFLDDGKMLFFLRAWSADRLGVVEGTSYSLLLPA